MQDFTLNTVEGISLRRMRASYSYAMSNRDGEAEEQPAFIHLLISWPQAGRNANGMALA